MTTITPRLQLPRPELDESADGPDAFNDLTDKLDPNTAIFAQGTFAGRPAAGTLGRFYWATDTHAMYYDDGTAWRTTGAESIGTGLPILDVGVQNQRRAGRQLAVTDFTSLGLTQPVGLWNLSDLTNLGSDARSLANKGAVPFGPGIGGLAATSAVFAGSTSQALYLPDSGAADPLRIRTGSWGAWARSAKRAIAQAFFTKYGVAQRAYYLGIGATNVVECIITSTSADPLTVNGVSDVADDRWHLIVATFDGTTLRIYVDGTREAIGFQSAPIFAGSGPLNIGGYGADAGAAAVLPFYGRVDEAFITADVLSEDQVRALYAAKLPHSLGVTPSSVRLNVTRRSKGAPLAVIDFAAQPLRLHNFTAGALTDQGSNAQALTNNGGALSVAGADGAPGGAYSFNVGPNLSATDAGLPAALTARSYGCWFKTVTATGAGYVMTWGQAAGTADVRLFVQTGAMRSDNGADAITGPFVADGQWHLVVEVEDNAAGDGVRRKLYLDGRLVGGSTVMNAITLSGANRFRVGAALDATLPFAGQIDGAFVTGYALTQDEVLRLWAKGSQALAPSPKNAGDHVEALQADGILWIADALESQNTVDVGVVA